MEVGGLAGQFGRRFITEAYEEAYGPRVALALYIEWLVPDDIIARRMERANYEEQPAAA